MTIIFYFAFLWPALVLCSRRPGPWIATSRFYLEKSVGTACTNVSFLPPLQRRRCPSPSLMSYLSFSNAPGFDIYANKGPHLVRVCSVMIALSAIAVALRFASRRLSGVQLSWDDWLILIALVSDARATFSGNMRLTFAKSLWHGSLVS